jgi:parallel beta-helix repeat protein
MASLAVIAGALALVSPAAAKTRVVTPGHSIQKAINKSKPGDTVLVKEGTYAQSLQVSTDKVTLRAEEGATLRQPGKLANTICNQQGGSATKQTGICVVGQIAVPAGGPPEVVKPVTRVRVAGFTIRGFGGDAVFVFGGTKTLVKRLLMIGNGGYGVFANTSRGTRLIANVAQNNGGPAFYVGDSPHANAVVRDNVALGNGMGIFLRSAEGGTISGNVLRDNCAGILVLGEAPGPSGHWTIRDNTATTNNKACPGSPDGDPAISGLGIGLGGANDTKVLNNRVDGNVHRHKSTASGGIVVQKSGHTAPSNVLVQGNSLAENSPFDLRWDGSGTATFRNNECERSKPSTLCH